jgi:hypothetical protein
MTVGLLKIVLDAIASKSCCMILLGLAAATIAGPSRGDEYSQTGVASARYPARPAARRRPVVIERMVEGPVVQLVPPCSDGWYPGLLGCTQPNVEILPPLDGALLNTKHGSPPPPREPFPTLFSW